MRMNVDALAAMPWHEAANLFPMMDEWEQEAGSKKAGALLQLAEDLKANGCHTPVVLFQGNILDGRNRVTAAKLAGLDFLPTTEYEGNDPVAYVLSLNLHRRQLTKAQLVELAIKLMPMYEGRVGKEIAEDSAISGKTSTIVAKAMGGAISDSLIERGVAVQKQAPTVWAEVQRGARSISDAYNQIKAPPAYNPTPTVDKLLDKADRAYDSFMDVIEEMKGAGATTENFLPVINMLNNLLKQAIKTQEAL